MNATIRKYLLWIILSMPGILILISYLTGKSTYDSMMHTTGEFAGRFLIIALIASPIGIVWPKLALGKWLIRNRRYFGLATFAYTLLHTLTYIKETSLIELGQSFIDFGILTGWLAFFIFIPLAITSNDKMMKQMGATWKKLQRWVYPAALLTLAHWAFVHFHWKPALIHFAPVMILQLARILKK